MLMAAWSACCCALLAGAGLRIARNAVRLRGLAGQHPPEPAEWPSVSVLVPACNEAATLEPAMRSLLAQDYPHLSVILVNDRSSDGTGAVVDRIAAGDPRVTPLHLSELPAGWLGKVHALARARERAAGAWLLATDADVHFAPGVLKRAVAFALAEEVGHLAVLPDVPVRGFWLRTAIAAFSQSFFLVFDARRMGVPRSGVMMGVGAFNLLRAADLDAAAGWADLRMEVIDDVGLAQILNRAGVRGACVGGAGLVGVAWYPSLRAMVHGLEKGAFAALGFSVARAVALVLGCFAVLGGLAAAPVVLPAPWGVRAVVAAWLIYVAGGMVGFRRLGVSAWLAVWAPLGSGINVWITARSVWKTLRRGGVDWRGTVYPLAALRAGQRVAF